MREDWKVSFADTPQGRRFITYDRGTLTQEARTRWPLGSRLAIRLPHGLPQDLELLNRLEDDLLARLTGVDCRMTARVTDATERQLAFQHAESAAFQTTLATYTAGHADLRFEVRDSQGWNWFDELVSPFEQAQPKDGFFKRFLNGLMGTAEPWPRSNDQRVLKVLAQSGSNLSLEHQIDFTFTGPGSRLLGIQSRLQGEGYAATSSPYAKDLVMSKTMVPDLDTIHQHSLKHVQLAREWGVTYDGWGTAVQQ